MLCRKKVGRGGLEPPCLAAHDPKSCSSANSDTSPYLKLPNLLTKSFASRRQGLLCNTIAFYKTCLNPLVENYDLTPEGINQFLRELGCSTGGKFVYFRAIRAFCNWLVRNDYLKDNPHKKLDSPKPGKPIPPLPPCTK